MSGCALSLAREEDGGMVATDEQRILRMAGVVFVFWLLVRFGGKASSNLESPNFPPPWKNLPRAFFHRGIITDPAGRGASIKEKR